MRNDFESNYLAHHGIQGQKWGVRNGPPYPLGTSAESSYEKKERKGLSDKQKTYIAIGAATAVSALAIYGTYKLGGLKGVAKAEKQVVSLISSGKKASKPYMKMNIQYFTDKNSKAVYSDGGCKMRNAEELARAENAFKQNNLSRAEWEKDTLIKTVQTDDKKNGAYQYHAYKSQDENKFKITHKVHVKDSATGYYERINKDDKK